VLVRKSLWLGPDHLLRLRSNLFSQEYRRYYFHDIQAIVITELPENTAVGYYALGGIALLGALSTLYLGHFGWAIASGFVAAVFLALPFLMADCACFIKTSVSTEKLAALKRLRAALRTAAILKSEIEKAQGQLDPQALLAAGPATLATPAILPPTKLVPYDHFVHAAFFSTMLALSGVTAFSMVNSAPAFSYIVSGLSYGVLLLGVIAAVVQRGTDLARNVRVVVFAALGWYGASVLANLTTAFYITIRFGTRVKDPAHHPAMLAVQSVNVVAFLILGWVGLTLLRQYQRRPKIMPVSSSEPPPLPTAPPPLPEGAPDDVHIR